jgi:hypothetical protein
VNLQLKTQRKSSWLWFLYFLAFCIIYLPWIDPGGGFPSLRIEWLVVLVAAILFPGRIKAAKTTYLLYGLVGLSMIVSIFWGYLAMNSAVSGQDLSELLKPVLYLLIYVVVVSIGISGKELPELQRVILIMLTIAAIIAIIQYFAPEIIQPILTLYTDTERLSAYKNSRATGTMGNANDLGMLFVLGSALAFFVHRQKLFGLFTGFLILALQILGVFASGSRTGAIALGVVLLYFLYIEIAKYRNFKSLVLLALFAVVALSIVGRFSDLLYQSIERYSSTSDFTEVRSLALRIVATLETFQLIRLSPVLGWGPNKNGFVIGNNVDNEYILLLYRYGIAGLLTVVGVFYHMWKRTRISKKAGNVVINSYSYFLTSMVLASGIFAYTAGIFSQFRLMTLIIIFLAVGDSVAHQNTSLVRGKNE